MEATEIKTKRCSKCGLEKAVDAFYINRALKDGLCVYCKQCVKEIGHNRNYSEEEKRRKKEREEYEKDNVYKSPEEVLNEAKESAENNPADSDVVLGFREKKPNIPKPIRKRGEMKIKIAKLGDFDQRKNQLTKANKLYKGFFLEAYRNLLSLGLSETTISRLFGADGNTLKNARLSRANEEIETAYQDAMDELELRLSHLMLVMAKGYGVEEEKLKYWKDKKTGKWKEVEKIIVKKHHPGDVQALIMYLTNRFPDKWKVSRELISSKKETYDQQPGQRDRKIIESQARDVLEKCTSTAETECGVSG